MPLAMAGPDPDIALPAQERAIRAKCFHRTGTFVSFPPEAVEQSLPERFEEQVRRFPHRPLRRDPPGPGALAGLDGCRHGRAGRGGLATGASPGWTPTGARSESRGLAGSVKAPPQDGQGGASIDPGLGAALRASR